MNTAPRMKALFTLSNQLRLALVRCHHDIYWISRRYVYPHMVLCPVICGHYPDLSSPFQNLLGKAQAQEKLEADNTMKADNRTHRFSHADFHHIFSLPMTIMLRALDEIHIVITAYSYSPSRDDSGVNVNDGNEASQPERKGIKEKSY